MNLVPNRDGFITAVQEGRQAKVIYGPSDDLGLVVDAIRAAVDTVGMGSNEISILPSATGPRVLSVEAKI